MFTDIQLKKTEISLKIRSLFAGRKRESPVLNLQSRGKSLCQTHLVIFRLGRIIAMERILYFNVKYFNDYDK